MRSRVELFAGIAGQGVVLLLIVALPWFFGGVYMSQRAVLTAALILPLLCACVLFRRSGEAWRSVRVPLLIFAAGCLLGAWQLTENAARWSPPAAALRSEFASGPNHEAPVAALSVHPPATRRDLALLIAAATAFALGAALFAETKPQLVLLITLTVSGAAVAGFGLAQRASSAPWHYAGMTAPIGSTPFGPFISRNNAAGYLCVCLAAAFGLLLWRIQRMPERGRDERHQSVYSWLLTSIDTPLMASAGAVIVLLAGVLGTLSRGGVFAAAVGGVVSLLILGAAARSQVYFWIIAAGTAAAVAFVVWLGQAEAIGARWSPILADGATRETRLQLWGESLKVAEVYRYFGSGLGTFYYAHAPFQRHHTLGLYRYGENQFVEALVVGGFIGLALLLALGAKCVAAMRQLVKNAESVDDTALASAGAAFLFSQAIYACFDFGWYLPAVMIPVAVWSGALVRRAADSVLRRSLRRRRKRKSSPGKPPTVAAPSAAASAAVHQEPPPKADVRSSAPRPVAATISTGQAVGYCAVVAVLLGAGLVWGVRETRIAAVVENAERGSRPLLLADANPTPEALDEAAVVQRRAVDACPDDGEARVRLAELLAERYARGRDRSLLQVYADACLTERIGNQAGLESLRGSELAKAYLRPASDECRRARALCPFNYFAQRLAAELCFVDESPTVDAWYLERAERLAQGRSDWLLVLGAMQLDAARPERAWADWRRAWELRPNLGETVFPLVLSYLEPLQALEKVVPDDPMTIIDAARRYLVEPEHAVARREYYRKAILKLYPAQLVDARSELFRGIALAETGNLEEAEASVSAALRDERAASEWYLELAVVRLAMGKTEAADVAFERYRLLLGDAAVSKEVYRRRAAELLQYQEPPDQAGLRRCGELYLQIGAVQEAVDAYRRATQRRSDDPEAFGGLANALLRQERPVEALAAARQALALQPTNLRRQDFVVELETAVKKAANP